MADSMSFPDTFDEFAEQYKIIDKEEVYTNGSELIPLFRVKQWLEHKADVAEMKHGQRHIMSEDPDDETDSPTEEGWYRIITYDGEEMTDYFFGKPTLVGYGIGYWRNCKKVIRAWAKMDGKDTNVST